MQQIIDLYKYKDNFIKNTGYKFLIIFATLLYKVFGKDNEPTPCEG